MPNWCYNEIAIPDKDLARNVFEFMISDDEWKSAARAFDWDRSIDESIGIMSFESRWAPPNELVLDTIKKFNLEKVEFYYEEEGMGFWGLWRRDGGNITMLECDIPHVEDLDQVSVLEEKYASKYPVGDFTGYDDESETDEEKIAYYNDYVINLFSDMTYDQRLELTKLLGADIEEEELAI